MASSSAEDSNLASRAAFVLSLIKERDPLHVDGVSSELHELPPFVPKEAWKSLGDALRKAEETPCTSISGDHWISLRCDGKGFSKLTRQLRGLGAFPAGWSETFANIMVECCRTLMQTFSAKCGYTQSDELIVLIPPANVIRGVQQSHQYNGRIQKLCSLAAATVSTKFNFKLMRLCMDLGLQLPEEHLATFDCRVGMCETQQQAVSLLLWRAYDCSVNGVSDAVFHCRGKIEGAKKSMNLSTRRKLQWLNQHSLLPLHPHQRDGTYLVNRKKIVETTSRLTGEAVTCMRSRIEPIPGNLLHLYRNGELFPDDEVLE